MLLVFGLMYAPDDYEYDGETLMSVTRREQSEISMRHV
jgi:hypothetical protein